MRTGVSVLRFYLALMFRMLRGDITECIVWYTPGSGFGVSLRRNTERVGEGLRKDLGNALVAALQDASKRVPR